MPIVITPDQIDWSRSSITVTIGGSSNATTGNAITWVTPVTATTKDVEMSRGEHQVHVTTDDNEEVVVECWTCTGFPQLAKLGKNPNVNQVYQTALDHWQS